MHEFAIAASIVESVLGFAAQNAVQRVVRVRLAIGELTCVQLDQLKFCFDSVASATMIENSELEMERVPAQVHCSHCAYQGPPAYWHDGPCLTPVATLQCPHCGGAAEAIQGHECAIRSIQCVKDAD